jgi:hypothetical protein
VKSAVLKMSIDGARHDSRIEGSSPLDAQANYFIGNKPANWRTHVPLFGEVLYRDVYPGIDLRFHGVGQELEYDWIVQPGADPRAIRMSFQGADRIDIEHTGDLVFHIGDLQLRHKRPRIYQDGREIAGRFVRRGRAVGFEVAAYDHTQALTIDPVLSYATYLGGSGADSGAAIAIDPQGNLLLIGITNSTDLPSRAGLIPSPPSRSGNAFVAKINPASRPWFG